MRHPYAVASNLNTLTRRHSLFALRSRPNTPEPDKQPLVDAPPPVPPLPLVPNRDLPPHLPSKSSTSGHYIKHTSKFTLLLSGQREGASIPQYRNGDTIEGILAIARPGGVLSLEVKIEGAIQSQEFAGSGIVNVKTIDQQIYSWNAAYHGLFPARASFRYTLPSTCVDPISEKPYPLPPTYAEELHGIPGFSVKIAYAVVVNLSLSREASSLWRGASSVRVPFRYTHRTRPGSAAPLPRNASRLLSSPRTMFETHMRSWRKDAPDIKVQLYLPSSPVCCHQEPIPFHVTLVADELTLAPFAEYRPLPSSFLPMSSPSSNSSCETLQHQLTSRKGAPKCPLRVKVVRTTTVATGTIALGCSPFHPRHVATDAVRTLFRSDDGSLTSPEIDSCRMQSTRTLGHGEVHSASRGSDSVVWTGAIIIPPNEKGFSEAFGVNGLKVAVRVPL